MNYLIFGLLFGFVETVYFGFNWKPSCRAEEICDVIAGGFILFGLVKMVISYEIRKYFAARNRQKDKLGVK